MSEAIPITPPDGDVSADAGLIRVAQDLLRRAIRLHGCDAGLIPISDDDYHADQEALCQGGRALAHMHPVTMAGLLAKARVVRVEFERTVACDRGQTVESMGESHERLAWSLMNDLLDVTGSLDGLPTFPPKATCA